MRRLLIIAGLLTGVVVGMARPVRPQSVKEAEALVRRLVPTAARRIEFREIPADTTDVFTLSSDGKKIIIGGNNAGAMAVGLNYYLNYCCKTTVSPYAAHKVELPPVLPAVEKPLRITARVKYRFYLNYCTFGYTMPWWGWTEWERFIDWMALNGVNMPLANTGEEAVWQRVWRRYGLSDEKIRAHFTGPAHLPWHRMVNINSFQGPLPQHWIDAQAALQKKILARERSLSMTPILHSFSGSVPEAFKDLHPEAAITKVSRWGGFGDQCRCWFLSPQDPLYPEIQKAFLEEQTALFGTDHIYGLDPFNEVQAPSWEPSAIAAMGRTFYDSLAAADPDAVWLMMGWFLSYDRKHWTPEVTEAFLAAVPKEKLILLDYGVDRIKIWKFTNRFYGHPYIACALLNFGGNTIFNGDLPAMETILDETFADGGPNMQGMGATLEGFGTNPYYYEYAMSRAWNFPWTLDEWIERLADRHIGRDDPAARELWKHLIRDVAPKYTGNGVSANGHPKFGPKNYHWTVKYPGIKGRTPIMDHAWRQMLEIGSDRYEYKYDLVNLGRQALGDYFDVLKDSLEAAWSRRDLEAAKACRSRMGEVLDDTDALLACAPEMDMRVWNEAARSWGKTPSEKNYYERNARTILTIWGPGRSLVDYANRQWAGLIKGYYKPRWMLFCDRIVAGIEDNDLCGETNFDERIRFLELSFIDPEATPIDYSRPSDPVELSRALIEKYGF